MARTVGVVIPAYRPDVDALAAYVNDLAATLSPESIRIELDDPAAATVATLESVPAIVSVAETRRGKGAAITAGFEALETDVLAFADADGSTAVDSVASIVERVARADADLVVGSRRHPESTVRGRQSAVRVRAGDAFAWTARRMLAVSLSDYQCGAKAIDRDAWKAVREHLRAPGFSWDVELVATTDALGYRIEEAPIAWTDDPRSTVSPVGTPIELVASLVRSRHRGKRLTGDPLHAAIASRRRRPVALIDRLGRGSCDD